MRNAVCLAFAFFVLISWLPPDVLSVPSCDSLRRQPCEGEECLAKYKAVHDCEMAVIAEEQARTRRRQLQRQRQNEIKRKKELDAAKD